MVNPVKAKMPMAQSKIMNSQPSKTAEGGKLIVAVGSEAQVSSWSEKQGSAVPLPPMQTNTIIS
jgi:hypothetical protein